MTGVAFDVAPNELGVEASGAIEELLGKVLGGLPVADYVISSPVDWSVFAGGGWDMLAAPEEADGGAATLRDLVVVAKVVGRWLPASPIMTTILAKRWSAAARDAEGSVTVAVRTPAGRTIVPFGSVENVQVLTDTGSSGTLRPPEDLVDDDFTPSLRAAEGGEPTQFDAVAARELAVVWAAEAVGAAERLLEIGVAFVKQREQFGQPIGRFQAIKHHLANALISLEQAESAVLWAGAEAPSLAAALDVAFTSALHTSEIVLQVHGGLGFTWELGLHMYLRHIVSLRQLAMALAVVADGE